MNGQGESRWGVTVAGCAVRQGQSDGIAEKGTACAGTGGEQSESRRSRVFHATEDGRQ